MKLKTALFSIVILTALFLSAFGSPAPSQAVKYQETVVPPEVTLVPTVVLGTPGEGIPVTGQEDAPGWWTLILFGLLALLGIAFLVALFSPRRVVHEHPDHDHIDRTPPHDHEV